MSHSISSEWRLPKSITKFRIPWRISSKNIIKEKSEVLKIPRSMDHMVAGIQNMWGLQLSKFGVYENCHILFIKIYHLKYRRRVRFIWSRLSGANNERRTKIRHLSASESLEHMIKSTELLDRKMERLCYDMEFFLEFQLFKGHSCNPCKSSRM